MKEFKEGDYVFFVVPLKDKNDYAIGGGKIKYINKDNNYMIDTFLGIYFEMKREEVFSTQKEAEDSISVRKNNKN